MAQYPSSQNTDSNLYLAVNNVATAVTDNPLSSVATTVNVSDTTNFPSDGIITIDLEAIHYTGKTATSFTGCTRGFDGTTAAVHVLNQPVRHDIPAAHHNVLKEEIKAISDDLRSSFISDLDDSATIATTATDVKERLDQLVTQIKNIISGSDWKDSPSDTLNGISSELVAIQTDLDDAVTAVASAADLKVRLNHIATQLKNISGETDWKTVPTNALNDMLPLSGGNMSGAIAMAVNKITGLAAATAAGDAIRFEQLKILQILSSMTGTQFTTTSATFTNTNLSLQITPSSTTSKILVLVSGGLEADNTGTNAEINIARGGTDLGGTHGLAVHHPSANVNSRVPASYVYMDSPVTTSTITYNVRLRSTDGTNTVGFPALSETATIILIEVNGA